MPEREVSIDRIPFSISAVCYCVGDFKDHLPDSVFDRLISYMHVQHRELREKLRAECSYAAAAYCLLKLIEDRKAEYRLSEELSKELGRNR